MSVERLADIITGAVASTCLPSSVVINVLSADKDTYKQHVSKDSIIASI